MGYVRLVRDVVCWDSCLMVEARFCDGLGWVECCLGLYLSVRRNAILEIIRTPFLLVPATQCRSPPCVELCFAPIINTLHPNFSPQKAYHRAYIHNSSDIYTNARGAYSNGQDACITSRPKSPFLLAKTSQSPGEPSTSGNCVPSLGKRVEMGRTCFPVVVGKSGAEEMRVRISLYPSILFVFAAWLAGREGKCLCDMQYGWVHEVRNIASVHCGTLIQNVSRTLGQLLQLVVKVVSQYCAWCKIELLRFLRHAARTLQAVMKFVSLHFHC